MSRALDTNVLVRAIVLDDVAQAARARALLSQPFILLPTVLIETEWVLRSTYRWTRPRIADSLTEIVDLPTAQTGTYRLDWAIAQFAQGADLADMVHVATAADAATFASFDRRLARQVGDNAPVPIETL